MKVGIAMEISFPLKLQAFPFLRLLTVKLFLLCLCQDLWASQRAVVVVDRAVVYADMDMSSPVGYVARGKKVVVGEIPRNKAQVYPIMVSGKVAYIRVLDVSTQKDALEDDYLVAERFQKTTKDKIRTAYGLAYYNYNTQINLNADNGNLKDKDSLSFSGISLRGTGIVEETWEISVLANYMVAQEGAEEFRVWELGLGGGYRFFEHGKFAAKFGAQALFIPVASYSYESLFRVNGQGYTFGSGLNLTYRFGEHWGLDAFGGLYYTKLASLDAPSQFQSIGPAFIGSRIGLGIQYVY